jgi:hypothetical protein
MAGDGKIKKEEAEQVAKTIKTKHDIFESISVTDAKERWDYAYIQRKVTGTVKGEIKDEVTLPRGLKYGDTVQYKVKERGASKIDDNIYTIHSVSKETKLVYLVADDGYAKRPQPLEDFEAMYKAREIVKVTKVKDPKLPEMPVCEIVFKTRKNKYYDEFRRQIALQERAINAMVIGHWLANKQRFENFGRDSRSQDAQDQARVDEAERMLNITFDRLIEEHVNAKGKAPSAAEMNRLEKKAIKIMEDYMAGTAALHGPDQVGGGHYKGLHGLGVLRVNSSLGSQWAKRFKDDDDNSNSDAVARGHKLLAHVNDFISKKKVKKADQMKIKMNVSLLIKIRTK